MSADRKDTQVARLNALSDRLFGEAAEVELSEAEELLKTAGIDPVRLKGALHQRMLQRSEKYSDSGQPSPPLLKQALEDLNPVPKPSKAEDAMARTARLTMTRLLKDIRELPQLLSTGFRPQFTAAYRNMKELSGRDIRVLDGVAEELWKRLGERKTHE